MAHERPPETTSTVRETVRSSCVPACSVGALLPSGGLSRRSLVCRGAFAATGDGRVKRPSPLFALCASVGVERVASGGQSQGSSLALTGALTTSPRPACCPSVSVCDQARGRVSSLHPLARPRASFFFGKVSHG